MECRQEICPSRVGGGLPTARCTEAPRGQVRPASGGNSQHTTPSTLTKTKHPPQVPPPPCSPASRRRAQAHATHDAAISHYSTLPHARTVAPGAVAGAHATTTRNAVARPWEHARPVRTWRVWWCSAYKTASHARTPGTAGYNETRAWGRRRPQQLAQRGYGCGGYYGPHTTKPLRGNPVWPCTAVQVHSGGGRGRVWWKSTARKPPRGRNMTYT